VTVAQNTSPRSLKKQEETYTIIGRDTQLSNEKHISGEVTMSDEHSDDGISAGDGDETRLEFESRLLDAAADPICAFDETGQLLYGNTALEEETGYNADEIRGEPLTLVMSNDDAQTLLNAVGELRGNLTNTVEMALELADDTTKPIECTLRLVDDDRAVAVGVMRDFTEVHEREQRLSKFARVVSHDLRNPLDVALGRAEMLPEIADVDEETEQHLHEIYNSLTRMEHLIEDVLTLTRQERDTIETEPVNLAAVATEAWRTVETHDGTLTVTTDATVSAHRARLRRIFENLFRNAIEHSEKQIDDSSGRESDVTVEVGLLDGAGDASGFYVADNGPGIDQQDRERLFEGGFTTANDGTGLGLTIVREIVRGHDWTVSLGDQKANPHLGGARFEISGVTMSPDADGKT
jgi:PAS domain S-box-containing protein